MSPEEMESDGGFLWGTFFRILGSSIVKTTLIGAGVGAVMFFIDNGMGLLTEKARFGTDYYFNKLWKFTVIGAAGGMITGTCLGIFSGIGKSIQYDVQEIAYGSIIR